ncbi:hypothetical protein [Moritella sp. PE36]|uniref:COG3904 family protein n=1 Tax=Moritella sp. PE36 TaxID=58051 RepID=UPI000694AD69|nr:hypothetical protein [Moritella sp. PE36]
MMNLSNTRLASSMLAALLITTLAGCNDSTSDKTTPTTSEAQKQLSAALPQATNVFGIQIRATAATPKEKIMHAANVMAQYLDNNEDGIPDNDLIVAKMVEKGATLVIGTTENELGRALGQLTLSDDMAIQDLYASEIHPKGTNSGQFDATLEEVLHLITHAGYAAVYPAAFGEKTGSDIANAMDIARGGRFDTIPSSYPEQAWYRYDDESCEYDCMVTEYTYWALTSILGAQETRLSNISQEWKLHTKDLVEQTDPAIFSLLTNPAYALATVLPDGDYDAINFAITVSDTSSGNGVDSNKAKVFEYITEQSDDTIAVYGAKNIEKLSYDRALADIQLVMDSLDADVKQGLLNSGVKMLIVSNEQALDDNIDYFQSLLPVEAIYTVQDGLDETLASAENAGLSTTKLELMYLVVYYSLLTEDNLSAAYSELQTAYAEATSKNLFIPGKAYQDGYDDEIHQHASDNNALKYGSYVFNLAKLYFGDDKGPAGEFNITTRAQLQRKNPLGYQIMENLFPDDDDENKSASFTFKDGDNSADTVYMNGLITSDTLDDIKTLLEQSPQITTMVMQNVPGSIDDEINLLASREIRKHGIATHIPADGMVASGGTDMFLAGIKRTIEPGAKIGVHSWGGGDLAATDYSRDHEVHVQYLDYYKEMNINTDFYWYTLEAAPADDILWMSEQDIAKYNVVTE